MAIVMAMSDSVTVSMGELTTGVANLNFLVTCVLKVHLQTDSSHNQGNDSACSTFRAVIRMLGQREEDIMAVVAAMGYKMPVRPASQMRVAPDQHACLMSNRS